MKRTVTILMILFSSLVSLLIGSCNLRLYASLYDPGRSDLPAQLTFLREALEGGTAVNMQQLFPEGYFFSYVLYGLAWTNWGSTNPDRQAQAIEEARWALHALESAAGRAVFSPTLDPPYGVFYAGWKSYLHGSILRLQDAPERDSADVERYQNDLDALAQAFERSETPFLPAYPGQSWPVDSVVGMAALRLHDEVFTPQYGSVIDRWLREAQTRLDPGTGLLPHRANLGTGAPVENARGSSQSLIAYFFTQIDPEWGKEQYEGFRQRFVVNYLGIPGTLEYPAGVVGLGDIDSGPLIFGVSLSASVVTAAAARANGDTALADAILDVGEALGFPITWAGSKRYALGLLPVGDAFVAWARSIPAAPTSEDTLLPIPPVLWRIPLHLISALLLVLLWVGVVWLWRRTR